MIFRAHHYVFLLHYLILTTQTAAVGPPAYTPTDIILLNCGDWNTSNDSSSRRWTGDEGSTYAPSHANKISSPVRTSSTDPSVPPVPYWTARVFRSPFTYTFPVSPGHKFLRLHFNHIIYIDFDTAHSLFSIKANDFTLLTDFSGLSGDSSRASFIKEFVVGVGGNQTSLHLTFSPVSNSFGFVNGIEIVSMPDNLYFEGRAIKYVDGEVFELRNDTALENVYRLNVGGIRVAIGDDSGMFREWSSDDDYLVGQDAGRSSHLENVQINYTTRTPRYTAPPQVYTSTRVPSNYSTALNWEFVVDSGFMYLLRFHLCEFRPQVEVTTQLRRRQRLFSIFINGYPAETRADVVSWAGGTQIPIFRDYVTWVPAKYVESNPQKQQLRLSLFVEYGAIHEDALLNGLEIFKLNNSRGVLAAAIPALSMEPRRSTAMYAAAVGSAVGVCALVVKISIFMVYQRQQKVNCSSSDAESSSRMPLSTTSSTSSGTSVSQHPSKLCTHFSLQEIRAATSNFHTGSIIGKGGFGHVYRGIIDNGATTVAVKRLNPSSNQGSLEFLTEIDMLSKLRHLHLVSLIGYCDDEAEMILVYDYMSHGSLRNHLYNTDNPPLTWKQRLQICNGAAKGLHYLHAGTQHSVIHRDVKSTNILLDENWVAKISDFGLSKMVEADDSFTHISTNVKGTFGYLDPKYFSTHQLTRKSDVYAFGVVMFELLSGRPAVDVSLEEEQHSLAGWARFCVRQGEVERLIDPNLVGQISAACLQVFVGIGGRSIHIQPLERPTMADVVMGLELALALQENTKVEEDEDDDDDEAVVVSMDGSKGVNRIMSLGYPRFS